MTVAHVLAQAPLNIRLRRALIGDKWTAWLDLVERLTRVNFSNESDRFKWHLTYTEVFSKSMYANFMRGHTKFLCKYLWNLKVSLKIFL
jgi:hypothetical protein